MSENGFSEIWRYLQSLPIDEELHRLDELARFPKNTRRDKQYYDRHWNDHKDVKNTSDQIMFTYSKKDYDEAAHLLSSYPAIPIGTGDDTEVYGYITQEGRRAKFIKANYGYAFVVYMLGDDGSDENGNTITYMHKNYNDLIFNANPFRKLTKNNDDHRYRSDLDGKFIGLNYFKPIFNQKSNVHITQDEYNIIRQEILSGKKISIR